MFSWNPISYGDIWSYEMQLLHFPGGPGGLREPPIQERHHQPIPQRFGNPTAAPTATENDPDTPILDFVRPCYVMGVVFVLVSLLQWLLFTLLVGKKGTFFLPGFICLALAFSSLVLLSFSEQLRYNIWLGRLFSWIFVETIAMGVILLLPERTVDNILIAASLAILVQILCYILGCRLPLKCLPGEIGLGIALIFLGVGGTLVLVLYIATEKHVFHAIYIGFVAIVTVAMSLYHAQILHGRRFLVPIKDYLSCSLVIFVHFELFFMAIYYLIWVFKW